MKLFVRILSVLFMVMFLSFESSGQYWKSVNLPSGYSSNYWLDIHFLPGNTQLGWACGFNASIVRTTDGGNTWIGSKVTQFQNPMLESIHFVSPQIGYTSGPQGIWKSIDGGASWTSITPPAVQGSLWGCYFKDQDLGLVIGEGCGGPQLFYRTTNGGNSWTLFQGSEPQSGMCDLILDQASDTGYASSSGVIWQSTNAGQTWSVFSRANSVNAWQEEIAWLGDSFLVPYSGQSCQGGGGGGGMCFTTNKGMSWNRVAAPDNLFGTFLTSATTGWACGYDRSVYYTSDAGRTWEYRNCGTTGSLDDIRMFSDTSGWVVGEGIYKMIPGFHEVLPKNGLSFANTCVNSLKHDSIIIRNYSFESTIVTITVNGPAASDFIIPFTSFALGQCEERLVPVTFRPTGSGTRNATIGISMINPLESFSIPLQGTASDITLSAGFRDTVNVGSHQVGTTTDSTFIVHNRSDAEIILSAINPLDLPKGHTLLWNNALPLRIPAKDSALLRYRIIMNDTGSTAQRFQFKFGLCDKTITMKSFGTSPRISSPENFVILSDCSPFKDSIFTITNSGNAMLVIHGLAISGGDSSAFSIRPHVLPMFIAPGKSASITLRYAKRLPLAPNAMSKLLIYHSDTMQTRASPRVVNLTGKRGYTIATATNDSLWAGTHCVGQKGKCSATLSVNGTGSTQIFGIVSKTGASKVISPTTFPVTITAPLSASIETSSLKAGRYRDTLLIISGICKDTIPFIVEAQAITTEIAFADSILTGTVDQGIPATLSWDLFSIGTALADIRSMKLIDNQGIQLADPLPRPSIINPGKSGRVSIRVTPKLSDSLLIDTLCIDALRECPTTICIPIRILVRQARLAISDTLLNIDLRCDSSAVTDTIMISNPGMLNDTILAITPRNVGGPISHNNRFTLPYVLTPGDSVPIFIRFEPKAQGNYSYTLDIESSSGRNVGKNQVIQVNGTFMAPAISASPMIFDAGIHEPCSQDTMLLVNISNAGLQNGLCSITSRGRSLIIKDSMVSVSASDNLVLNILHRPSLAGIGSWKDTLVITDLTCDKSVMVFVHGIVDTISITKSPDAIAYSTVYRDDSVSRTVIIKNTSPFSITIDSLSFRSTLPEYEWSSTKTFPFMMPSLDTMHISLKAHALSEGSAPRNELLVHAHRDCKATVSIPVSMDVPIESYTAILSTEDYEVEYGDTMTIYCRLQGDLSLARLRSLSYTVHLDGKLFSIIKTQPQGLISHIDSVISWTIPVDSIPLKGGIISRIHGRALVTQYRKAPITFSNILAETNRTISIDTISGSLNVSSVCANSLTGFKETTLLSMRVLPPLPIQSRITIGYRSTTNEIASGSVRVYSLEGALLFTGELSGLAEEQSFVVPNTFSPGTYIIEFQSKQYLKREILLIAP